MGSWNNTCQISQLPIHAGEPVRFLLLSKSPYRMDSFETHNTNRENEPNSYVGREGTYSGNFWYPELAPVLARYNDYGSVEDLDQSTLNWQFWQQTIDERLVELEQGPNPYHDPSSKKGMPLDQLLDVLGEGRLRFKCDYYDLAIPICQTMIREDVYQSMLTIPLEESWWMEKDDDKYTPESIYNHGIKMFTTEHPKVSAFKDIEGMQDLLDDLDHDHKNYFSNGLHESEGEKGLKPYRAWIRKAIREGKMNVESEQFKTLVKDISDFIYIKSIHSQLRMGWHPGVGMGSQSSNLKMANTFHRNVAKIATTVRKARHW